MSAMSKSIIVSALVILFAGCNLEQMGKNLGRGVASGVESRADSIALRAVQGVDLGLSESELRAYIASITDTVGLSLKQELAGIRQELLGDSTRLLVGAIRSELLGAATREQVQLLIDHALANQLRGNLLSIRNELLGDSLGMLLGNVRDELTGPILQANVALIAEALLTEVADSYVEKLRPAIQDDIRFARDQVNQTGQGLSRTIKSVLWAVGVIIAGLIALVAYFRMNRNKHKELIEMLTHRIEKLQTVDPKVHDVLTEQIQEQAINKNLEPMLRNILKEQGIIGT